MASIYLDKNVCGDAGSNIISEFQNCPANAAYKTVEEFGIGSTHRTMAKTRPHVLVLPYPAQGHVLPLMEFSLQLVQHGIKVTFVNTDFYHQMILKSLPEGENLPEFMNMVSLPDGLEPWENRSDLLRLTRGILAVMPGELGALIKKINATGDEIVCVIVDWTIVGWALEVAEKLRIKSAVFWPGPAAVLAVSFSIPKLVDDGIIDSEGKLLKKQMVQLSPTIPLMNSANFNWTCLHDPVLQKLAFELMSHNNISTKFADWIVCNSAQDLEAGAFSMFPDILPVGPLLARNRLGNSVGCFWPVESSCLAWLDKQPANSVIYVAFGSLALLDQSQFEELALGLELINRPFLWVVRQDVNADTEREYPKGFKDRVEGRGEIVSWAPQQQVLSHPSVACFISHCGWNSTVESIGNGVPFLCWPYFADQFLNESYICDEWEVGLRFDREESGIISRKEIEDKVERVLTDKSYKVRALELQAKTAYSVSEGCSQENFNNFIEGIKKL